MKLGISIFNAAVAVLNWGVGNRFWAGACTVGAIWMLCEFIEDRI